MMTTVVLLVHVILALVLVTLILLQHGKGADAGAAFGSGASSTVFGAQGSASFLSRATKWLAVLFFVTSGSLAYLSRDVQGPAPSVMDLEPPTVERQLPSERQEADQDLPPVDSPAEEDDVPEEDAPPPGGAA